MVAADRNSAVSDYHSGVLRLHWDPREGRCRDWAGYCMGSALEAAVEMQQMTGS